MKPLTTEFRFARSGMLPPVPIASDGDEVGILGAPIAPPTATAVPPWLEDELEGLAAHGVVQHTARPAVHGDVVFTDGRWLHWPQQFRNQLAWAVLVSAEEGPPVAHVYLADLRGDETPDGPSWTAKTSSPVSYTQCRVDWVPRPG